ncbi:hypothetical protein [Gymnodinialimonas hymeniacidonis]|uniref:hypothetical protein n=1 Tax=Gymnodinialimonas hymeniacidonis TaxID=3126508 RepID=UPI0034C5B3FF
MIHLAVLLLLIATPATAQTCTLTLSIRTEAIHGAHPEGTSLQAELTFTPTRRMRMGAEATAYLTDGTVQITGPDGTGLTGRLGVVHIVRAPHWADYMSFDIVDVAGDLGGVTDYEDPMLLSFYAERGEVASFNLPTTQAAFDQFDRRQTFQVHTPDTMWTLPGSVHDPSLTCEPT